MFITLSPSMEDVDSNTVSKIIEKELTKVKYKCFGKVKLSAKSKDDKELEALQLKKMEISTRLSPEEKERTTN